MSISPGDPPPEGHRWSAPARTASLAEGRDGLTGLSDRSQFQLRLERDLAEAALAGEEIALIVFDIDRFKQINNSLGCENGDLLLKAVVRRVARILRRSDFFARLGGDEFAVIARFPEPARRAGYNLAESILAVFSQGFSIDGRAVRARATIGVALAPGQAGTATELRRLADLALDSGKTLGGNRICLFEEQMRVVSESRWMMEEQLRAAIDARDIDVCYQPIVDLRTGRIAGVEALARWRHPVMGSVPAEQFIRIAEENQMIGELDRQVLARACGDTQRWIGDGSIDFFSVNLSPPQAGNPDDAAELLATLADKAVDPRALVLEITERLMLPDSPGALRGLETLRAQGVRLALDDFGAGFSNLSYLNRFPIDRIKIDRDLTADIADRDFAAIIVQSVTDLAHRLGLLVIVEGIETAEQLRIITRMGCDYAQGFWFGHALPAAEMGALLERRRESAT
jgi:diguanylate cyclase (GGDEF)-like protein